MGSEMCIRDSIYVADTGNHRIRKISPAGVVTTLAGGESGDKIGDLSEARFNAPRDVAISTEGTVGFPGIAGTLDILFVADRDNHRILKIDLKNETVSNFAGTGESKVDHFRVVSETFRTRDPCDIFSKIFNNCTYTCLLYTSPSPRDATLSRMPSSA